MPHRASRERNWREQWTHLVGCGKDEFSELADANGVYRMKRSRSRGGIRLISGRWDEINAGVLMITAFGLIWLVLQYYG